MFSVKFQDQSQLINIFYIFEVLLLWYLHEIHLKYHKDITTTFEFETNWTNDSVDCFKCQHIKRHMCKIESHQTFAIFYVKYWTENCQSTAWWSSWIIVSSIIYSYITGWTVWTLVQTRWQLFTHQIEGGGCCTFKLCMSSDRCDAPQKCACPLPGVFRCRFPSWLGWVPGGTQKFPPVTECELRTAPPEAARSWPGNIQWTVDTGPAS